LCFYVAAILWREIAIEMLKALDHSRHGGFGDYFPPLEWGAHRRGPESKNAWGYAALARREVPESKC